MTESQPRTTVSNLSGWGRYPVARATRVWRPERISEAIPPVAGHVLARGQGRSYGDAALLDDGLVLLTERLNRFYSFDERPVYCAWRQVRLSPRCSLDSSRWRFPPVTPGTKYVSLGGCMAADVHGKNHHRDGTFGVHTSELNLCWLTGAAGGVRRARTQSYSGQPSAAWG